MTAAGDLLALARANGLLAAERLLDTDPALLERREGESPILLALREDLPRLADLLVRKGARLDVWEAAAVDAVPRLAELLAGDPALVRAPSPDGWTPLHLAARYGRVDAAWTLLCAGADPEAPAENALADTPLHQAAAARRLPVLELLLAAGAHPDARDADGRTPLHAAAETGALDVAKVLLGAGADARAADARGRSAAEVAREAGRAKIAATIERAA